MSHEPKHAYGEDETLMIHAGHFATIRYNARNDEFLGKVVSIPARDLVCFRGRSIEELRHDMAAQLALYEDRKAKRPLF